MSQVQYFNKVNLLPKDLWFGLNMGVPFVSYSIVEVLELCFGWKPPVATGLIVKYDFALLFTRDN